MVTLCTHDYTFPSMRDSEKQFPTTLNSTKVSCLIYRKFKQQETFVRYRRNPWSNNLIKDFLFMNSYRKLGHIPMNKRLSWPTLGRSGNVINTTRTVGVGRLTKTICIFMKRQPINVFVLRFTCLSNQRTQKSYSYQNFNDCNSGTMIKFKIKAIHWMSD